MVRQTGKAKRGISTEEDARPFIQHVNRYVFGFLGSKLFLYLSIVWFSFQAIYMAISTQFGIAPDEVYHFSLIKLFATNGWLPFIHSQQGYYFLGEAIHQPFFLYHYLLSLPFHLFGSSPHAYVYLRLINIALAVATLLLVGRIARQLGFSATIRNLTVFMLSGTLMFVFLAGSISYDNLFGLIGLASISLLLSILGRVSALKLLALLVLMLAGFMTKISYLPIGFGVVIVLAYHFRANYRRTFKSIASSFDDRKMINVALGVLVVCLLAVFLQRYGVNVITYHRLSPSCTQVHTLEQCRQNGIFLRTETIHAKNIHASADALTYLSTWTLAMRDWTFGILGAKHIFPTRPVQIFTDLFLIIGLLGLARYYDKKDRQTNIILFLLIIYIAALIRTDYHAFTHSGMILLAVQGRYLFVFLPLLYLLANSYAFRVFRNEYLKLVYVGLVVVFFLFSSLPTYILKTNDSWHTAATQRVNQKLQHGLLDLKKRAP